MIAEGFTCQRYGFNVGADKFSLLTIENGKTSIMRLSEWTLISQSQKSHSDRLLAFVVFIEAPYIGQYTMISEKQLRKSEIMLKRSRIIIPEYPYL